MNPNYFANSDHLFIIRIGITKFQIISQSPLEKIGFLQDNRQLSSEGFELKPSQIDSVYGYRSIIRVIEPADEVYDTGLSRSCRCLKQGKPLGTFGDLGTLSFHETKNVTSGEGGMVATDNSEWAEKITTVPRQTIARIARAVTAASLP